MTRSDLIRRVTLSTESRWNILATVTNTTNTVGLPSRTINTLDTYVTLGVGPVQLTATGGAKKDGLPFPFAHIGDLTAGGTKQLAMQPRDFSHKDVCNSGSPHSAGEEWMGLIQRGVVTLTYAAETGRRDAEELYLAAV